MNKARIRTPRIEDRRYAARDTKIRERVLVVVVLILLVWVTAGPFGLFRLYRLKEEHHRLSQEKRAISTRIEHLKAEIQGLSTNRALQEKVVRSELGWVRDDEILYEFKKK